MRDVPEKSLFKGEFTERASNAGGIDNRRQLAKTGAIAILSKEENRGKTAYFAGIQNCKFKGKVVPGDKIRLETKMIKQKGPFGIGEATASVEGKVVVRAELTFMIG